MKKKLHQHQRYRWRAIISGLICITLTIFLLQANYMPHLRLSYFDSPAKPKIAFLFIARNRLPLDFVWQRFFQGAEEATFSIYIHSRPGFIYSKATTSCAYFYRRQLSDSIQVDWGEASMLQAERILLRKALQDPANQRFIFISDSCVPLYNFSYIYDYVMSSSQSFVDSDRKEGRYNPKMSGTIPVEKCEIGVTSYHPSSNLGDNSAAYNKSSGHEGPETLASDSGIDLIYLQVASDDELGIPLSPALDFKDEVCQSTKETSEGLFNSPDVEAFGENWHFEDDFESYQQYSWFEDASDASKLRDYMNRDFISPDLFFEGDFSVAWTSETACCI